MQRSMRFETSRPRERFDGFFKVSVVDFLVGCHVSVTRKRRFKCTVAQFTLDCLARHLVRNRRILSVVRILSVLVSHVCVPREDVCELDAAHAAVHTAAARTTPVAHSKPEPGRSWQSSTA